MAAAEGARAGGAIVAVLSSAAEERRRQDAPSGDLLTGIALQHDLGLLIEQLSDRLRLSAALMGEPVLSIADVTEQFNIASKTVQRWRRRGLPARRFTFADGKRRVGFLLSSVERFVRSHRQQVLDDGPNISLVEADERKMMLRAARRLATVGRCWPEEIARRLGRRLHRSPLTVLHTVRRHDEINPTGAIFPLAAKPMGERTRARILRRYKKGWSITGLAKRAKRPRWAIYRVLMDERIARLQRRPIRFIDDPLYHQPHATDVITVLASAAPMDIAEQRGALTSGRGNRSINVSISGASSGASSGERSRLAGDPGHAIDRELMLPTGNLPRDVPTALRQLCQTPLLTPAGERGLFLKLNFHKFQFVQARRRLDPQFARCRDLATLEKHLTAVTAVRNHLTTANLRLVVSVARKHLRPGIALMELVSDGNITLMRAIDGFDVHRGTRFSTYATLALMKGFARSAGAAGSGEAKIGAAGAGGTRWGRARGRRESMDDQALPDCRGSHAQQMDDRDELAVLLGRLDERERDVVGSRFGLREWTEDGRRERDHADGDRDGGRAIGPATEVFSCESIEKKVTATVNLAGKNCSCATLRKGSRERNRTNRVPERVGAAPTIRQLAASLGLTTPRFRELERSAMAKMRLGAGGIDGGG